jgi:hypothetical protein
MQWNTGFESGVAGQALVSNDATGGWGSVTGTCTYSSAHAKSGGLSMLATAHTSTDKSRVSKPYGTNYTNLDVYGRAYFWIDALPVGGRIVMIEPVDSVNQGNLTIGMNTSGNILVGYSGNEVLFTSVSKINPGQWCRVEWHVNVGGASPVADVRLYARAPESSTPDETFQITGLNLSTESAAVFFGCFARAGVTNANVYLDSVAVADTGWIGPDVTATTKVTKSPSLAWNVRVPVLLQKSTSWNLLQTRSVQRQASWNLRAGVAKLAQQAWIVRSAVSSSQQLAWNAFARPSRTASASWNLSARIAVVGAASWGVRVATSTSGQAVWTVLASAWTTTGASWRVNVSAQTSQSSSWAILSRTATTRPAAWNIASHVTAASNTGWNIAGTVATARPIRWNTRAPITTTSSTAWNVRNALSQSASSGWRVFEASGPKSVSAAWNIRTPISLSASSRWNCRTKLTIRRSSTWDIYFRGGFFQYPIAWNVRGLFANPDIPLMVLDRMSTMRDSDRRPIRNPASNETLG